MRIAHVLDCSINMLPRCSIVCFFSSSKFNLTLSLCISLLFLEISSFLFLKFVCSLVSFKIASFKLRNYASLLMLLIPSIVFLIIVNCSSVYLSMKPMLSKYSLYLPVTISSSLLQSTYNFPKLDSIFFVVTVSFSTLDW